MKKILATAVITSAIAGAAFAGTNVVSSANIVGYVNTDLAMNQIKIVAPQFLAGATNGATLGSAFSGLADATVLYTWDGANYATYTYYVGYGWYDGGYAEANNVLLGQGSAMWLQTVDAASVIMAGDVPMVGSVTNTIVAGINLIANPYPVALKLSDIPTASLSDADTAYVWDGSGYANYTYYVGYGWYDGGYAEANNVEIPVGQGFWLQTAAGGSMIFNKLF